MGQRLREIIRKVRKPVIFTKLVVLFMVLGSLDKSTSVGLVEGSLSFWELLLIWIASG